MTGFQLPTRCGNIALASGARSTGWLHDRQGQNRFLREHGGQKNNYDYKKWHQKTTVSCDNLLQWVKKFGLVNNGGPNARFCLQT